MNMFTALKTTRVVTALILSSLLALAGCGGGGSTSTPIQPTTLNATLNGTQEVPTAITSPATGTATVTVDAAKTTITVTMQTQGFVSPVISSHIHFGATGVNGSIMFSLFAGPGAFPATLTKTLTSADFAPVTGVATFAEAVNAILSGNAYINVHTQANAGGEIRGQIGTSTPIQPTTLNAVLNGSKEVPTAITSPATGTATVTVDAAKTTITVTMQTQGFVSPVISSHIHFGATGVNGSIMFSLFAGPGAFPATLTKTLTSADFAPVTGVATFAEAVNAILSGNAYINVHTQANAGGEIRGQLTP